MDSITYLTNMHYRSHIALSALRNIFIAFTALTFVACSNDDITSSDIKEPHDSTFTLYIPDIERETRATFQVTQAETGVENIWFLAYDAEGPTSQTPKIAIDIKGNKADN
ncbi:MAG: hypothetical protein J1F43_03545, partial [Muribaculaceae bacterium]|nr:hypothetical protein [Muribaculaceae bacterium]